MAAARYWRLSGFTTRGSAYLELAQLELWGGGAKITASLSCALDPVTGTLANLSDADLNTKGKWLVCPGLAFVFDCTTSQTVDVPRFGAADLSEFVASFLLETSSDALAWTTQSTFSRVVYPGAAALTNVTGGSGDASFANVTLLLHCDGANGSTTFTDSSGTPKTATVYGAAAISTTQSKFSGASLRTTGTSGVMFPSSGLIDMGAGDFTIEFFVRVDALGNYTLVNNYGSSAATSNFVIQATSTGVLQAYIFVGSASVGACFTSAATLAANTWQHIAYVRNGSAFALYVEGVSKATATGSGTMNSASAKLRIGMESDTGSYGVAAYFDEVRITKGLARHTGAFTPPAAPFEGASGVPVITETALAVQTLLANTADIISAVTPPAFGIYAQAHAFNLTRFDLSGRGTVVGTVAVAPSTPVARRVRLYRDIDGRFMGETWSDPVTGVYVFHEVPDAVSYTAISYDHTDMFNAVASDKIFPELV